MKRVLVGLAVAGAAAFTAAPAAADPVEVQRCYATVFYPCGVCVDARYAQQCTRN